ncbi:protein kinase domain-containing protein [Acanthopleuribacter pedis]|uniref:Protein kinase n=1 Tax=Acanthopleuribacter pedis TaxID=442870 RepID=A0A8J7QH01_9BACT|nr:serine/threonine-protein kinase [Acanthopleuribacter pedis]MBO1318430.1 protein kinase [Acanthopleuribacter pedis]
MTANGHAGLTGTELGRFKVEELLGKGGMGEVYRGTDQLLGRSVALKTISHRQRMSPLTKTRFFREAQILSKLAHPNICGIYDLIEQEDYDILVLEYLDGQTLRALMRNEEDDWDKLAVAETVATVLQVAHQARIVHRDLKPDNVMISAEGDVKVLDFGLARPTEPQVEDTDAAVAFVAPAPRGDLSEAATLDGLNDICEQPTLSLAASDSANLRSDRTTHGTVVGTPRYMSPEQARGEEATAASDMYAFGIILQEMLTGRPAYKKNLPYHALLMKVGKGEKFPLDPQGDNLDPDLVRLINDLTRLDPSTRITAVETLLRLQQIRGKPSLKRRGRRRIAALGTLVALLVITALVTAWFNRQSPLIMRDETLSAALLPLLNETDEKGSEWMKIGLAELLQEKLDDIPSLTMLPSDSVQRALGNQPDDQLLDRPGVDQLTQRLGADLLIQAVVDKDPVTGQYHLVYHLYRDDKHYKSRNIIAQNPTFAIRAVVAQINNRLHPESKMTPNHGEVFSEDPYALMIWSMGFHQLTTGNAASARHYFEICVERDPGFLKAIYSLAATHYQLGNYEEMRKLCNNLLEREDEDPDLTLKANVYTLLGDLAKHDGNWEKTHYYYQLAKDLYLKNEDPSGFANALNRLGIIFWGKGELDKAESYFMQALAIFRKENNQVDGVQCIQNLGLIAAARDDNEEARRYYQEALDIAVEIQDRDVEAANYNNLGSLALKAYDYQQADRLFHQALAIYEEVGHDQYAAYLLFNLARGAESRNRLDESEHLNMQALVKHRKLQEPFLRAHIHQLSGVIALKRNQLDTAENELTQALTIFKKIDNAAGVRNSRLLLAELFIGRNRLQEAETLLEALSEDDPELPRLKFLRLLLAYQRDQRQAAFEGLLALEASEPNVFAPEEVALLEWMRRRLQEKQRVPLPMRADLLALMPIPDPAMNPN